MGLEKALEPQKSVLNCKDREIFENSLLHQTAELEEDFVPLRGVQR